MKFLFICMLFAVNIHAQNNGQQNLKWKLDKNKAITGGLIFVAGSARGFNETLQFHWKKFYQKFPNTNPNWFNPQISWRNKYEGGDPSKGAKFPLSTSALVMFTDQYHLNNFINRASITAALIIKIGEKKKPFGYYVKDLLYYTACYQIGWSVTYLPFKY